MSYLKPTYYQSRGAVVYFDRVEVRGARDISGFTTAGSTPELDITDLQALRRQFVPGLADGGGIGMSVISAPNSEIYQKFASSNRLQRTRRLDIYFGGVKAGDRRCNATPIDVETDLASFFLKGTGGGRTGPTIDQFDFCVVDGSGVSSTLVEKTTPATGEVNWPSGNTGIGSLTDTGTVKKFGIRATKDAARSVSNGFGKNDFIAIGDGNYYRIKEVIEETKGSDDNAKQYTLFILDVGSSITHTQAGIGTITAANGYAEPSFRIVRPALRFSIPTYIADFQNSTGAGGLIEMQVAYRVADEGTLYVGNQSIVEEDDFPSSPFVETPSYFWDGAWYANPRGGHTRTAPATP